MISAILPPPKYYSLDDIENLIFNGIEYQLPQSVIETIKFIEKELNLPPEVEVSQETKRPNSGKRHQSSSSSSSSGGNRRGQNNKNTEDWNTLRSFKSTKIESKEGTEKACNDVRILLNKISNKNYETQKNLILEFIRNFFLETGETEQEKLANVVFGIISTNQFFIELYSDLYKELINNFTIFKTILDNFVVSFHHTIDIINYKDPDIDYSEYCDYIKINDIRKTNSKFVVFMYKHSFIEKSIIINILEYFLDKSLEYIDIENKTNEIEEITDNIFIFFTQLQPLLLNDDQWKNDIITKIIKISHMKIKEHPSLTNRIIFKYMDIIDSLE
jgi:hypothetical protein